MALHFATALAVFALSGCGLSKPPIPSQIERLTEAEFPADGRIYIRARGKFQIKPDTRFCTFRPGYGLDGRQLVDALKKMGQSDYWDGATRINCVTDDPNFAERLPELQQSGVFIRVTQSDNRNGEPYRLVLAVWQGDPAKGGAIWVGGVERQGGGLHPEAFVPGDDMPGEGRGDDDSERMVTASVSLDNDRLSNEFTSDLSGER